MKENTHSHWEEFVSHCEKNLGISRKTLDMISISNILDLCVRGFSNTHIADYLDIDKAYVKTILESTMGFSGFKTNIDYSPLFLFKKLSKEEFRERFEKHLQNSKQLENLLTFCKKYEEIERQLDEYYGD